MHLPIRTHKYFVGRSLFVTANAAILAVPTWKVFTITNAILHRLPVHETEFGAPASVVDLAWQMILSMHNFLLVHHSFSAAVVTGMLIWPVVLLLAIAWFWHQSLVVKLWHVRQDRVKIWTKQRLDYLYGWFLYSFCCALLIGMLFAQA